MRNLDNTIGILILRKTFTVIIWYWGSYSFGIFVRNKQNVILKIALESLFLELNVSKRYSFSLTNQGNFCSIHQLAVLKKPLENNVGQADKAFGVSRSTYALLIHRDDDTCRLLTRNHYTVPLSAQRFTTCRWRHLSGIFTHTPTR